MTRCGQTWCATVMQPSCPWEVALAEEFCCCGGPVQLLYSTSHGGPGLLLYE